MSEFGLGILAKCKKSEVNVEQSLVIY